jgi:GDSL-like Lipase/Acylhydrolase family
MGTRQDDGRTADSPSGLDGPVPSGRLLPRLRIGRGWARVLAGLALIVAALLATSAALEITPLQTVTVAGQVIKVGAAPRLGLSGPGEVDLFGQGLPTAISIPGPIQLKLQLSQITLNSELTNFVQGSSPGEDGQSLRTQLVAGWEHYFGWEAVVAGLAALILAGAVAGWRRLPPKSTALVLVLGLLVTEAINLGAIAVTANGARGALHKVSSLNQLVGSANVTVPPQPDQPPLHGIQEVVLGDSTAAGAGLPLVADPSAADSACGRSTQSYALALAAAHGWTALNLACDSATIAQGLLGPQQLNGQQIPPQIDAARRVQRPAVVIVSVGADDLQWSAILQVCATSVCDSRASNAYFQQRLAEFSTSYLQLLIQLGQLSGHPQIVINRYYDPFGSNVSCITHRGLTAAKVKTIQTWLAALNQVLAKGAAQFGYLSPQPSFTGHELCSPQPYVQGLAASAPFHPTALGQLDIALTDEIALASHPAPPSPSATASRSAPAR